MSDLRAEYLASLEDALVGPRRVRRSLLREAGDHLEDATAGYVDVGLDEEAAAARAVEEFGSVEEVAPHFQTTLAVSSARRTALLLLTVLAVQPFVWDGEPAATPEGLLYRVLDTGVEALGLLMLAFALVVALACGIGNRWFHAGRSVARVAALGTLGSGVALAVIGVSMTIIAGGPQLQPWALLTGFILLPVAGTSLAARRTLATC